MGNSHSKKKKEETHERYRIIHKRYDDVDSESSNVFPPYITLVSYCLDVKNSFYDSHQNLPRYDKAKQSGQIPLYLRIIQNRKSRYLSLGVAIEADDGDERMRRLKPTATNATTINSYLARKLAEAEAIALELTMKSGFLTACDIRSHIMGDKPKDFLEFMKEWIEAQIDESSIGTTDKRYVVLNKLVGFCHGKPLHFDEGTIRFIRDFQSYLKDQRGNHTNTIHSNLKVIRKMLEEAISENLMPFEKNPFNRIRLKSQKTFREFLLDEELSKIEDLQLTPGSMMDHHRNLYVFSAYTGGIRISDLLMMRWRNFNGEHLYFQIRKTQEELSILLPEQSKQIIHYYKEIATKRQGVIHPDTFIFPLVKLQPKETDRKAIYKGISSATAYTNKNLRKISALAGISKHLSFHSARHSWAVRALQKGMRIEYVSKLMGHASVRQTEVYAKILNAELDKAMAIFNKH